MIQIITPYFTLYTPPFSNIRIYEIWTVHKTIWTEIWVNSWSKRTRITSKVNYEIQTKNSFYLWINLYIVSCIYICVRLVQNIHPNFKKFHFSIWLWLYCAQNECFRLFRAPRIPTSYQFFFFVTNKYYTLTPLCILNFFLLYVYFIIRIIIAKKHKHWIRKKYNHFYTHSLISFNFFIYHKCNCISLFIWWFVLFDTVLVWFKKKKIKRTKR